MKRINVKIAMIAVILGISGAFSFSAKAVKHSRTTFDWYAVSTDGVHFTWQSTVPSGICSAAAGTCEISTTVSGTPPANGYPSSYMVLQGPDKDSAYEN